MFWSKGPKEGDFRIAEVFIPESNDTVFRVERYDDGEYNDWYTKQICATIEKAVDWVNRYRKADNVRYHYL